LSTVTLFDEQALTFSCAGEQLIGIASVPRQPGARGVLIVVGGPQYRGGSHRQFTLLARSLAEQGIAALRFDYRGMGDSDGDARDFEAVDDDLKAAIDQFFQVVPSLREVVIWGLCDAASAAMFYAAKDARVTGLVLLNPWARTEAGLAKATLKHYYRARLFDPALWKKIITGNFAFGSAATSLLRQLASAIKPRSITGGRDSDSSLALAFPERMLAGLSAFTGKVLFIICPADLTAQEFIDMTLASSAWQRLLENPRVQRHDLAEADHTCSRRAWRDQVADWTARWVRSW
jgi:exosortase A-associated hydrolase 1